jgi:hypothetical protein
MQLLSACEPAGDPRLSEDVVSTYAPACGIPVLLSHRPPSAASLRAAEPANAPEEESTGRRTARSKPAAPANRMPMARRVASSLPSTTPSRTVLVHNYPLHGAARRIEGSRFLGDHPEQLFPFLDHHSRPLQTKQGGSRRPTHGPSAASRLHASRSAPQLRSSLFAPL